MVVGPMVNELNLWFQSYDKNGNFYKSGLACQVLSHNSTTVSQIDIIPSLQSHQAFLYRAICVYQET